MGLGDIFEILIPAFIIYQFIKSFTQNKKKGQEHEEVANPDLPAPTQPEKLNDVLQSLFSDQGFTPGRKTSSSQPANQEKADSETAHILGRKVQKPLDEVDLDAPSHRRDAVQFDHSKTRYEDEFSRQKEFMSATKPGGHNYFKEEADAELFDSNHGFGALSSNEIPTVIEVEETIGKSPVNGLFTDPESFQKAIVMKEVIDPPVSLRHRKRG
jgi:hypothetical protein